MNHRPDLSLADVLPSAAAALGVPGYEDLLEVGDARFVVVLLVDGLGSQAIDKHPEYFSAMRGARGGSIEAAFPTTTATGLASLGTGLPPGAHGILGASFYLPDSDEFLSPLHWGSHPSPLVVQPERTVFEAAALAGVATVAVGPAAYAGSGLTHAALRGSTYLQAESIEDRIACIERAAQGRESTLAYVYWPALDRAGHEYGGESEQWRDAAVDVNTLITQLLTVVPGGGKLVVTADHGMVTCHDRVWIEDEPLLMSGVRHIAGEPRMRYLYIARDQVEAVRQQWRGVLGDRISIYRRDEAIEQGFFGRVDDGLAERIGDLVVLCHGHTCLASRTADPRLSTLIGQHGSTSEDERRIPGIIFDA